MLDLDADEKIILFKRRHWLVLFMKIAFLTFLFAFFVIAVFYLGKAVEYPGLVVLSGFVLVHLLWVMLFVNLADYYLDTWILTTKRIIDIEQKGLFNREFSEFKLDKLQDVSVDVVGVMPTFFHYGDVLVQTAGEEKDFIFEQVPHPHDTKSSIINQYDKFVKTQRPPRQSL